MSRDNFIVQLDNALTLLRMTQLRHKMTGPELSLLNLAVHHAITKIDQAIGPPGFDTAAAFEEFFGRPLE